MVVHPILESRFFAAVRADRAARLHALAAARDPGDRRGVRLSRGGLIERYRDRLPFAPGDPVVSLRRGLDAARAAPSACPSASGAEVWLKLEGANPTGSFKDRGMTCAVSAAVREGAEAVICASTGNTAASAAAYAARAGLDRRGDRPRGQDRDRQARPGADARRARDRAARQLRRGAARSSASSPSATRSRSSTRSTRSGSRARRRRPSRSLEELGELDALCIPVGNAGNITAYWKGFAEVGAAPRMLGFQAAGAAPLVHGRAGRRSPRRWRARSASATRRAGRRRWRR